MKRYFKHQLKSYSRAIIIITVLMMIVSFFVAAESMRHERYTLFVKVGEKVYTSVEYSYNGEKNVPTRYHDGKGYVNITDEEIIEVSYRDLSLFYPASLLFLLAVAVPVWMFGFMKKKRNLDCFYSLPISKRETGTVQYLLGGIAAVIPFVFSYAVMLACNASYGLFGNLEHKYIFYHFLICLIAGFILYSLSCFVFEKANTVIDGIVMICVYMLLLYLLISNTEAITNKIFQISYRLEYGEYIESLRPGTAGVAPRLRYLSLNEDNAMPFYFFEELLNYLECDAEMIYVNYTSKYFGDSDLNWFIAWCVIGLLSSFGLIYGFNKKKAESAEESSSSIFCYKLLIPLCCISTNINLGIFDSTETTSCLAITVACAVGYAIYRRGVRFKKSDYIVLGIMLALTVCSMFTYDLIIDSLPRIDTYSEIIYEVVAI